MLTGGIGRSLRAPLTSPFVRPPMTMLVSSEHHPDLATLTELIDAGKLTPSIEATYPLEHTQDAIRQLEAGTIRGKISDRDSFTAHTPLNQSHTAKHGRQHQRDDEPRHTNSTCVRTLERP